ncbi:NlpC/P60 family protein [Streptomyces sp. C10-9-1]|uniref:C40 family peptidase n=1 Tax=Streptomyces sp. C10-9-1 TaxID=1859285 RepID=UPI002112164A|nr:C40 family peptidase [Streptomyces sp. C10-9-1]MCQ6556925.1 NlpC/P60 family protein [Streptomyces sp. C10-9-1]
MVSHRRPSQTGLAASARVTVLSAAAATAAAALASAPAGAEPRETAAATRAEVDRLYTEAERATERFNRADEDAGRLRERVSGARDRLARGQERINGMRRTLGSVAGAQYRSGVDPSLELFLSSDPDSYLERAAALERLGDRHSRTLAEFRDAQRALDQQRAEVARDLTELERSRSAVARHKRSVERKLAQARRLLERLPAAERASRSGRDGGAPGPVLLASGSRHASSAAAAARGAVGSPYVWGANGPSGFDCSGLVQWSYAQAGVALPRTSQGQANAGRRIPLSEARPGDIVTYRGDASHVGMYMGNGQVVHAPYPGAAVRYDPVGMMPVHAVTRV